ncbi:MAG TPA: CAP domain-containing protein [Candidatus Dormibacteraeota bacterium]|nr:CAP domain-containing protein [Candidatus Dormibacteraeota bacterium]
MRLVSWLGGLSVVGAILVTAGAVTSMHHRPVAPRTLTAAHQAVGLTLYDDLDPGAAPPQLIPPSPTPVPVPPAAAAPAPAPARAAIVIGSTQQALINQDRARNGLAPLTWSGCLYSVARAQAAHLATPGVAFAHYGGVYQDLNCRLGPQTGENIGWWSLGVNDTQLNTMFMNSPEHRANILGPYHYVATAWVVGANGYGYIAVEFG